MQLRTSPRTRHDKSLFYEKPDWWSGTDQKIKAHPETRVAAGYFVHWDDCILNDENQCWKAPPSPTGYEAFHQGTYIAACGTEIPVGVIGGGGEHADPYSTVEAAATYYADVNKQMMVGRVHEDEVGAYFLGYVLPDVQQAGIDLINRSALSGDWRYRQNMRTLAGKQASGYDCLGPWLVTRPGFPLNRRGFVRTASAHAEFPVMWSVFGAKQANADLDFIDEPEEIVNEDDLAQRLSDLEQNYEMLAIKVENMAAPEDVELDTDDVPIIGG